jgi:hypothetical protein
LIWMPIAATRMHRALTNFGSSDMCGFRRFLLRFSYNIFDVDRSSYEADQNSGPQHSIPKAKGTPQFAVAVNTASEGNLVSKMDHHGPSMSVGEQLRTSPAS